MATTCFLPDLLPITSAQPLNETSAPRHALCLAAPSYSCHKVQCGCTVTLPAVLLVWETESITHTVQLPLFSWGREAEAENSTSFSRGQRTDGFAFTPLLKVGEQEGLLGKIIRTILKCVLFFEYSGTFWRVLFIVGYFCLSTKFLARYLYFPYYFFIWELIMGFGTCSFSLFGNTKANNYIINMFPW